MQNSLIASGYFQVHLPGTQLTEDWEQKNMAESDLASYQLQLQQVEAALLADPESGELQKLKEDLVQVIELTRELITAAEPSAAAADANDKPAAATATSNIETQFSTIWDDFKPCLADKTKSKKD